MDPSTIVMEAQEYYRWITWSPDGTMLASVADESLKVLRLDKDIKGVSLPSLFLHSPFFSSKASLMIFRLPSSVVSRKKRAERDNGWIEPRRARTMLLEPTRQQPRCDGLEGQARDRVGREDKESRDVPQSASKEQEH